MLVVWHATLRGFFILLDFYAIKRWVLMMDFFFPLILQWSSTFSWPQLYISPSLFCAMEAMLNFQSFTCNTTPYSNESRQQLATTTLLGLPTQSSNLHMICFVLFPLCKKEKMTQQFWAVWTSGSQYQNWELMVPKGINQPVGRTIN